MGKPPRERPELSRLGQICLELPEAERELSGKHAVFRVRTRTFAYFLDDHQGDGELAVACKAAAGRNRALVDEDPERYYLPAYISHHGWVAQRLDADRVDWDAVTALVLESYLLIAPKRLGEQVIADD